MLKVLRRGVGSFETPEPADGWTLPEDAVWIELVEPTRAEELAVEKALGVELPTREEMAEIETSSRLYREGNDLFMTAQVVANSDGETPVIGPVTFVLTGAGIEAKAAFAKVGVLMASARRTAQALHPTNLHVNAKLFPRDTIQSRLPDPEWLERWLDKQIQFDTVWENKVVERILHNMSLLMERSFASVQELNRFRKELTQRLAQAAPQAQGGDGAPQAT